MYKSLLNEKLLENQLSGKYKALSQEKDTTSNSLNDHED